MQVDGAKRAHEQYVQRVLQFMEQYDLLCCPCVMTGPFDVNIRYIAGKPVLVDFSAMSCCSIRVRCTIACVVQHVPSLCAQVLTVGCSHSVKAM